MLVIKDAMVIIHLAKTTLLEASCDYFGETYMPMLVYEEVTRSGHSDIHIIQEIVGKGKIKIKKVENEKNIRKANEFNIQRGEAEAVALYWELNADFIATDDDNVRKKQNALHINVIGTPTIMLKLYLEKKIDKEKLRNAIKKMREIGWFAQTIWDKILLEVEKNA